MILLDTHAWIWWASEPSRLSRRVTAAISEDRDLGVSAISCWELATLVRRGRLRLDRPTELWIQQALSPSEVVPLDVTPEIAAAAGAFDDAFPGDPADRILVATALAHDVRIATRDSRLRALDVVRTVW